MPFGNVVGSNVASAPEADWMAIGMAEVVAVVLSCDGGVPVPEATVCADSTGAPCSLAVSFQASTVVPSRGVTEPIVTGVGSVRTAPSAGANSVTAGPSPGVVSPGSDEPPPSVVGVVHVTCTEFDTAASPATRAVAKAYSSPAESALSANVAAPLASVTAL